MLEFEHPYEAFRAWFAEAEQAEPRVPEAMQITTVAEGSIPSVRTVLMKANDPDGVVFYTNTRSRKGRELAANPNVAAVFHWKSLERQVLIQGRVTPVAPEVADAYWATRPRKSQLGAWASDQSETIASREALEARMSDAEARFASVEDVPRPPHWSGFHIFVTRWEFWQGRRSRLHERDVYTLTEGGQWQRSLLMP